MLLHYWQNGETRKLHFTFFNALLEFNQQLDSFNLFNSQLILTLLYDLSLIHI